MADKFEFELYNIVLLLLHQLNHSKVDLLIECISFLYSLSNKSIYSAVGFFFFINPCSASSTSPSFSLPFQRIINPPTIPKINKKGAEPTNSVFYPCIVIKSSHSVRLHSQSFTFFFFCLFPSATSHCFSCVFILLFVQFVLENLNLLKSSVLLPTTRFKKPIIVWMSLLAWNKHSFEFWIPHGSLVQMWFVYRKHTWCVTTFWFFLSLSLYFRFQDLCYLLNYSTLFAPIPRHCVDLDFVVLVNLFRCYYGASSEEQRAIGLPFS